MVIFKKEFKSSDYFSLELEIKKIWNIRYIQRTNVSKSRYIAACQKMMNFL